jgi:hypothetical protein
MHMILQPIFPSFSCTVILLATTTAVTEEFVIRRDIINALIGASISVHALFKAQVVANTLTKVIADSVVAFRNCSIGHSYLD